MCRCYSVILGLRIVMISFTNKISIFDSLYGYHHHVLQIVKDISHKIGFHFSQSVNLKGFRTPPLSQ